MLVVHTIFFLSLLELGFSKLELPTVYTVSGVLRLPYAEIYEYFTAYHDPHGNGSRMDFYHGMSVTIQNSELNETFKLVSITTEKVYDERHCFYSGPPAGSNTTLQSIFPNRLASLFKLSDPIQLIVPEYSISCKVDVWQYTVTNFTRKSTYTLYIGTKTSPFPNIPIRYEMFGYDSLLGSHYDKYIIDYDPRTFNTTEPDTKLFAKPKGCMPMPNQSTDFHNPMGEFVDGDDSAIHKQFESFKESHGKRYKNKPEHEKRKFYFKHHVRFINSQNRAGLSYTLEINHFADQSTSELKYLRGRLYRPGYNGGLAFDMSSYNKTQPTPSLDWRLYGAVTPVKDQAVCGSCWSFGTTGTLEGMYFLKTGKLVKLSQQELIDCSWGAGNNGCDGGIDYQAYQWIEKRGGIATQENYGPYLGVDGICHYKKLTMTPQVRVKGYVNVTAGDADALRMALFKEGPISVSIDASHKSFVFYANGVYYEPKCGNKPDQLDHSVLAVGYGVINSQAYWLIKNSWSTHWGNDGYVLMAVRENNCGVMTSPTFPIVW